MADGTVIAGIFDGMATSRTLGCDWTLEGPLQGVNVVDLSVQKDNPARAVAISSNGDGTGNFINRVWRTADSAASWVELGPQLSAEVLPFTIDTAPSDPRRIYVSGFEYYAEGGPQRESVMLRSDDDGASFTRLPLGPIGFDLEPYIAAIHPADSGKVYVRLRDRSNPSRTMINRLIYSDDAGVSWRELFVGAADMLGFALSPDGSRVALGLGDSRELGGARPVDKAVFGIYAASTSDHVFTRTREGQVGCMSWTERGMYFCSAGVGVEDAFELGLSGDEGATVRKLMLLPGVEGPLACPAESQTARVCEAQGNWPNLCVTIGRCDFTTGKVVNAPRGDECPQGPGPGPGAGGSSGTPDGGSGAPGAAPESLRIDDGCSVSRPGSGPIAWLALAGLTGLGVAQLARRQRRRER
jgi:hypothetical protein